MSPLSLLWPPGSGAWDDCAALSDQIVEDLGLRRIAEAMAGSDLPRSALLQALVSPSRNATAIAYRQEILADFAEAAELEQGFAEFLPKISQLAYFTETRKGQTTPLRQALWRLGELELYVECVTDLSRLLSGRVRSDGLRALVRFVEEKRESQIFERLRQELPRISSAIKRRSSVTVGINLDERLRPVEAAILSVSDRRIGERSLLARLMGTDGELTLKAIAPLHTNVSPRAAGLPPRSTLPLAPLFQDLEDLLKAVARPVVRAIDAFMKVNTGLLAALAPEISFFLGGLRLQRLLRDAGLPTCLPEIRPAEERVFQAEDFYNLLMALRFQAAAPNEQLADRVVRNDAILSGDSGVFILTGPNRGGKTTYTQGFGIAQVLAQCGLPFPGARAVISVVDHLVTHFPREERGELETGRLGEEASRLAAIFDTITRRSLVLLNESLSSTSPGESLYLAEDIIRAFRLVGCRAVFATHLHELAGRSDAINEEVPGDSRVVSVVAGTETPVPHSANGEARRTYRIRPGPPAGRSFAKDIADRHGISYERLVETLKTRKVV